MTVPAEGGSGSFEMGEQVLELATAIADRELYEYELVQKMTGGISGTQPNLLPLEVRRSIAVTKTVTAIKRIEDPTYRPTFDELMQEVDFTTVERAVKRANEETGEDIEFEPVMGAVTAMIKNLLDDAGQDAAKNAEQFGRTFGMAKVVAEERGVGVADVYRDDAMYIEVFGRAQTPAEYAGDALSIADAFSERLMGGFLLQLVEVILPADVREDISDEEMQEMLVELKAEPEMQEGLREAVAVAQAGMKQMAIAQVIRIWGMDALRALPQEIQDKLGVNESRLIQNDDKVIEVGGMAILGASSEQADMLRQREAFVQTYFDKMGWDVNNPTMEQVLEVRSQPGWQNPSV